MVFPTFWGINLLKINKNIPQLMYFLKRALNFATFKMTFNTPYELWGGCGKIIVR